MGPTRIKHQEEQDGKGPEQERIEGRFQHPLANLPFTRPTRQPTPARNRGSLLSLSGFVVAQRARAPPKPSMTGINPSGDSNFLEADQTGASFRWAPRFNG